MKTSAYPPPALKQVMLWTGQDAQGVFQTGFAEVEFNIYSATKETPGKGVGHSATSLFIPPRTV